MRGGLPLRAATYFVLGIFFSLAGVPSLRAQDAASPKFTVFAGAGVLATKGSSHGEIQAGASLDEAPPDAWGGFSFEAGYLGPWANPRVGSALLSVDYMAAWNQGRTGNGRTANGSRYWADRGWKVLPFASAGYSRLFGTGNAVNFGGGFDYRLSQHRAIRAEVRDYYSFSTPARHNLALRIGYVFYIRD